LIKQLRCIDAMKILLTDDPVDAAEALRIGLINEVVPHAQLMERAETIARHIVTMPPVTLRMMKEFVVRFRRPADRPALARAEPDQQSADPGDDRRRGWATGLQREAPPNFPARCAAAAMPKKSPRQSTPTALTIPVAPASFEDRSRTEGTPSEILPPCPAGAGCRSWPPSHQSGNRSLIG
jgi:hypothetical protein